MGRSMLQMRRQMLALPFPVWLVLAAFAPTAWGLRDEVDKLQLDFNPNDLPRRLKDGDSVQCGSMTWIIGKRLGRGAQGRVFAVTEAGTSGPVRAMKMDLETHGAFHARTTSSRIKKTEEGMPHEDIPECGILEALAKKGVSAVPQCFAGCAPEGFNTAVMTAVVNGKWLDLKEWLNLNNDQQRAIADANVKHVFDFVQAEVNPSDTEAYLDDEKNLMFIDWGGAFQATYKSSAYWADTSFKDIFEMGLPHVQGLGTIAPDLCKMDTFENLRKLSDLTKTAFCREKKGRDKWVVATAKGGILKSFEDCPKEEIPSLDCTVRKVPSRPSTDIRRRRSRK